MSEQLDKVFEPQSVEPEILELWDKKGASRATPDECGRDKRFVVMMPLPNVTGKLHLGHAINNTLQDIMTRWHRMRGFNCLYQPGTDHAGIATQAVVERRIREEEGKSRHDLGRDELVRRIWEWKADYEARILNQLKMMGCSCDWDRVRFTLDDRYSESVHETFFQWFKDGLIYRGERLVNWDTELMTAVADDEVYHETVKGHFWHFKYPINKKEPRTSVRADAESPDYLCFATTRPETMLGDVAIAVNPDDARYKSLVGKTVLVPLFDPPCEIPIITDEWADPEKGTGCVKITPAHDFNDSEVGRRHAELVPINVLTTDGRVGELGGKYAGMVFRTEARKAIIADMDAMGLLDRIEDINVDIPHSDRSKSPIEPFMSKQWFVRMGDVDNGIDIADGSTVPGLAQSAMDAVTEHKVRILPERYAKTYLDWLKEKRDWCISRQLWWGHRIPVWHHLTETHSEQVDMAELSASLKTEHFIPQYGQGESGEGNHADANDSLEDRVEYICFRREPDDREEAILKEKGFVRDPDVLDTWFSSQLFPFATIGWPEETADLDFYYPGTVLITSRDIITLWVARMVLSGLYSMGELPFRDVYIHPKILDGRGETMSKSKGNGVDPLDIIHTHGADALRFTMASMCTETQDIRMPVEYICPHCGHLTDQVEAIKIERQARKSRGEKLERKLQPSDVQRVSCKGCKKDFATQWASAETKEVLPVGRETSDKFDIGRNFATKLWNAARFAFMNVEGVQRAKLDIASLPTEDRWILAQLSRTVRALHENLSLYRYSASIKLLRDFFWDSLCDWYIELTKARMKDGDKGAEAKQIIAFCVDQILRLLHPFMPFITERLWSELNAVAPERGLPGVAEVEADDLLMTAAYPPENGWPALDDEAVLSTFEAMQEMTRAVRDLRQRNNIVPKEVVTVTINVPADRVAALTDHAGIVQRLANVGTINIGSNATRPQNSGTVVTGAMQIYVHDVSDDDAERAKLKEELADAEKQIGIKEKRLANEGFVRNAKPEVVEAERERLQSLAERRQGIEQNLALLG